MTIYQRRYKTRKKKEKTYNRGDRTAQSTRYRNKNKIKVAAHKAVYAAIKKGTLKRPKRCPICRKRRLVCAHHPDYTKKLDVKWACGKCHNNIHGRVKE